MKRLSLILTALALIAATAGLAQQLPPPSIEQPTVVSTTDGLVTTPAISRSGHIFVTDATAKLVVLNPDKSLAASAVIASGNTCKASPVLNGDASRAYCATTDGNVVCFSVSYASGTVSLAPLWTRQLPMEETVGNETIGTSLVATPSLSESGSRLYVVTGSGSPTRGHGRLFALSTVDGQDSSGWSGGKPAGGATFSHFAPSPAIMADGKIVVASALSPASIKAFNPDGSVAWNTVLGQMVQGSPAIGTDGRIFVTTWTDPGVNWTICLNGSSGTELWRVEIITLTKGGPVISSFGEVVVSDVGGNVYGFTQDGKNAQNHTGYRWTVNAASWGSTHQDGVVPCQAALIDAGGNAIVVEHNGWIRSIAPNGTARWTSSISVPSGESLYGSPTMTPGGKVLVLANSGKLYSFDNAFGPDAGIWPGFQRGSTHSGNIGENAIDRGNLSYTVSYFPGTPEMRWNSSYGYYEWITNYSTVNAVNDRGHVAGYSTASSWATTKAVEWFSGYTLTLQGPPYANDPDGSQAYGMNSRGDTVGRFGKGYYGTYGSGNTGILWERNGSGTLGQGYLLPWSTLIPSGEAKAINTDKWVVGNGFNSFGTRRAVLWPYAAPNGGGILPTTMNDLETLEGVGAGFWSESIGISAGKVIAGNSVAYQGGTATTRPFRLDYNDHSTINENGAADELPDPGASVGTTLVRPRQWIRGINENGQIVGTVTVDTSGSSSFPTKGYIYRHSTTAALSYKVPATQLVYEDGRNNIYGVDEAVAINARGQVLFKGFRYYNATPGSAQVVVERPYYLLYTPSRTGYYNVTRQVFPAGAQINGLTDDGKLYGYVYYGGLPIGFVAVPN